MVRKTSVLLNDQACKVLEDNGITNLTGFLNHIIFKWGEHVKKGGRQVLDELFKDLDLYALINLKWEQIIGGKP